MNETHSADDRNLKIKKAANKYNITLMTNSFGRGTDFILFDKTIAKMGGLHVIQTFLSVDASEEIQIQGRTARQGEKGSYKLIITSEELELLNLKGSKLNNIQLDISEARKKLD